MLDSDQEPSDNLSKNLLLLPRILKLMKDMVDDSTPLLIIRRNKNNIFHGLFFFLFKRRYQMATSCHNMYSAYS